VVEGAGEGFGTVVVVVEGLVVPGAGTVVVVDGAAGGVVDPGPGAAPSASPSGPVGAGSSGVDVVVSLTVSAGREESVGERTFLPATGLSVRCSPGWPGSSRSAEVSAPAVNVSAR